MNGQKQISDHVACGTNASSPLAYMKSLDKHPDKEGPISVAQTITSRGLVSNGQTKKEWPVPKKTNIEPEFRGVMHELAH